MDNLTGKKIIIFGAGLVGKRALIYFGSRNVKCFVDNNKAGEFYCGKNVISFEELCQIHAEYDVVLAVSLSYTTLVCKQFNLSGIPYMYFRDMLTISDFEINPNLSKFKSKYLGERCFLIGNGPSLQAKDLDVLHKNNVVSFGCNRIYKIFDETDWRPQYLFIHERPLRRIDCDIIKQLDVSHIFFMDAGETAPENPVPHRDNYYFYDAIPIRSSQPAFSNNPARSSFACATSMYILLQWVAYMGFSEIYLLGVDNNYTVDIDKVVANQDPNHFCSDYIDEAVVACFQSTDENPELAAEIRCDEMAAAYKSAESYSRENGFRIYNATRGGNLEVFERVNFDDLF